MKTKVARLLSIMSVATGIFAFTLAPALANWPGFYTYIGAFDGDIVGGRKDNYYSGNAYIIFENGSVAGSVSYWVDHKGYPKTAQYSVSKGSERSLPYKDSEWSGSAMLRGRNNTPWVGEELVRGSINFDS